MKLAWLVCLSACATQFEPPDIREVGRDALSGAASDEGKLAKLLRGSATNAGMWFLDPACAKQFPQAAELPADQLHAFAHCLAGLHLRPSARKDALGDVVVMTYPPGFEVEARVAHESYGSHLMWIGYVGRRSMEDDLPTVSGAALEELRLAGDRNGPLAPEVAGALELDAVAGEHGARAWLKVCVDQTGTVKSASVYETTTPKAGKAFAEAAAAWKFKPFLVGDKPMPVCSLMRLAYPPTAAAEIIPLPPPAARDKHPDPVMLAPGAKEMPALLSGDLILAPDDQTKIAISEAHVRHMTGNFRICLDETGHVGSVLPLRSTGFAAYDREVMAAMHKWAYVPFIVDGKPAAVCTQITVNYSQP
jgi:TonB family protein